MTIPFEIPFALIDTSNRAREDLGDIESLAHSIVEKGTIQPIVLKIEDDKISLVAGGRRYAAMQLIDPPVTTLYHGASCDPNRYGFVLTSELDPQTLLEIELEENIRRKDMTWQEQCLGIHKLHKIHSRKAALTSSDWSMQLTAELLGLKNKASVSYATTVADALLITPKTTIWECTSMAEAVKYIMKQKEEMLQRELARKMGLQVQNGQIVSSIPKITQEEINQLIQESGIKDQSALDIQKQNAKEKYEANVLNTQSFEEYWTKRQIEIENYRNTVNLSNRIFNIDCRTFMSNPDNHGRFDHIITDPPYGIDMDNLVQSNPLAGMIGIEDVEKEHQVEENNKLLEDFFLLAYNCLKPNGFCIVWADYMMWQKLYDLAIASGFGVQRWPYVWIKEGNCMNQMANVNFTKTSEIAVICRKGNCTLNRPNIPSHVIVKNDATLKKELGGHAFSKPFEVWQPLIEAISLKGQTILEPFSGKGSGPISMLRLERNVIALEKVEMHYVDLVENVKSHFKMLNSKSLFV